MNILETEHCWKFWTSKPFRIERLCDIRHSFEKIEGPCFKSKACPNTRLTELLYKGLLSKYLRILDHMFSVATIQLCHLSAKKSYRQSINRLVFKKPKK